MSSNEDKSKKKEIVKTWLAGKHSCTLVIPKDFAESYGLAEPSHVIVEGRPDGILIRKLEV
jgi:hypothetical protein